MSMLLLILAYAVLGVLFLIIIIGLLWEKSLIFNQAPFVPIPKESLAGIVETLNLPADAIVYDLGCGDGRVLEACLKVQPRATYYGIEKEIVPFFLAKHRLKAFIKNQRCSIIKKNFFAAPLQDATHIFTYLFPKLMDQLLPKLEAELKPGTRLVSCDFLFHSKEPIATIDLKRPAHALGKRLYIYQF